KDCEFIWFLMLVFALLRQVTIVRVRVPTAAFKSEKVRFLRRIFQPSNASPKNSCHVRPRFGRKQGRLDLLSPVPVSIVARTIACQSATNAQQHASSPITPLGEIASAEDGQNSPV